jgi:hypothetical protein
MIQNTISKNKSFAKAAILAFSAIAGAMPFANAQTFAPNNIAVFVTASNSANNTSASIIELNTSSLASPVNTYTVDGTLLRFSGSATSTGYLANSNDGTLICFNGGATSSTSGNINTIIPRGIGTFNNAGTFNIAATYTGTSGNQTRSSTS